MTSFEEGDDVEVTIKGKVLWVGDRTVEIDNWLADLAFLRYPNVTVRKIS